MSHVLLKVDHDGLIEEAVPCASCSMPLAGVRASGLCPGCGDPVAHSLLGRAVANVDDQNRITETVFCGACGYPVTGLEADGACPECQSPVGPDLEANLLRYARRKWVKKVSDGFLMYLLGLGVAILIGLGNGIISALVQDIAIRMVAGMTAVVVSGAFLIPAIWWVTSPDPDVDLSLQKRRGANLARLLVIPQFGLAIPSAYLSGTAITQQAQMTAGLVQMPLSIVGLLVAVGMLLHFKELARRVVDEKLEGWARTIVWIYVIGFVVAVIGASVLMAMGVASGATGGSGASPPTGLALAGMAVGGLTACVGGIASFVAMVWMVVLIFKLRGYFSKAAKMAVLSQRE